MGRLMAVDLGSRRIGLALSDELRITAGPALTIPRAGAVERLRELVRQYDVEKLVVGLPLNMDGSPGPKAEEARRFAERLRRELGLPVEMWDERLTTVQAERALLEADLRRSRRKAVRDRAAAALLLQSYLDSRKPPGTDRI